LRDAIELEWAGLPAVAVVHEALAGSADAMRLMSGMPQYPFLEVKFPLPPVGPWTPEQVDELCDELLPHVIEQLTHDVPGPVHPPGEQARQPIAAMAMVEHDPASPEDGRRALAP
jgi:hypothetical protein